MWIRPYNLLGRISRLLIICRRPNLAGRGLGGRLLDLLALGYSSLLLGLGVLLVVTVTEAEWVVLGNGGWLDRGQGLPLARLVTSRGAALAWRGIVEVIDVGGRAVLEGNPPTRGWRYSLLEVCAAGAGPRRARGRDWLNAISGG